MVVQRAHPRTVRPPIERAPRASLPGKEHGAGSGQFQAHIASPEIALLQIKDIAKLRPVTSGQRSFKLIESLALPAAGFNNIG